MPVPVSGILSGITDPVSSIRAIVARHLAQHGLRRAFIAFSGGPDSTVLADAAIAANMHADLGWTEDAVRREFDAFLPVLHDHLHELARTA
ncbi:MAG: hypothetical protein F9K40_23155, partial [Kofleriaceae bacterium]